MKRAFVDLHQSRAADEQIRAKLKHQTLLEEYLQLQKEFVSKKRKLQATKQKRENLFAEIRFLRRRRRYLLEIPSPKHDLEEGYVQPRDSDMPRKMLEKKRNHSVTGASLVSNPDKREQISEKPLRKEKKFKNQSINERRLGKKKISWQDDLPLKV
ncbi:uncharacterized protein LOC130792558 [Actinidia eriantha]|uniref:uncharacterized protein LOC130792558 n=1 Tax=Actinidia eriantha TaxID=165200 RepID=UPI00258A31D3|nr:uncharacterized protein LOC130792558 [Actinidia eriantha]